MNARILGCSVPELVNTKTVMLLENMEKNQCPVHGLKPPGRATQAWVPKAVYTGQGVHGMTVGGKERPGQLTPRSAFSPGPGGEDVSAVYPGRPLVPVTGHSLCPWKPRCRTPFQMQERENHQHPEGQMLPQLQNKPIRHLAAPRLLHLPQQPTRKEGGGSVSQV